MEKRITARIASPIATIGGQCFLNTDGDASAGVPLAGEAIVEFPLPGIPSFRTLSARDAPKKNNTAYTFSGSVFKKKFQE
jgi:hypothetical protein